MDVTPHMNQFIQQWDLYLQYNNKHYLSTYNHHHIKSNQIKSIESLNARVSLSKGILSTVGDV